MPVRRKDGVVVVLAAALLFVSGCSGGSDEESAKQPSTPSESSSPLPESQSPAALPSSDVSMDSRKVDDGEPGEPDKQGRQSDVFERVAGSAGYRCANVGESRDVRSGGFVAGPFDDAVEQYGSSTLQGNSREIQLYFVPRHAAKMQDLRLRPTGPEGQPGRVTRVGQGSTGEWRFYDTSIVVPEGGRWTVRVSAGVDRGCFIVNFPS